MKKTTGRWFHLTILSCAITLTISGCEQYGTLEGILDKFDKAINEVKKTREMIENESGKWLPESKAWREQLLKMQGQLKSDASDLIRNDLSDLVQGSIDSAGMEFRCEVDFIEQKIKRHLQSVEDALREKRDEIKKTGKLDGLVDDIISKVAKGVGDIPPFVCRSSADLDKGMLINYENQYGQPVVLRSNDDAVRFLGFALLRPNIEAKRYSAAILGEDNIERPIVNFENVMPITRYYARLDLRAPEIKFLPKDRRLTLRWGDEALYVVGLTFGPEPPPPVKAPKVVAVWLLVDTTTDGKDREIRFIYDAWTPYEQIASFPAGNPHWPDGDKGDIWEKGEKREFKIPMNKPFMFADRTQCAISVFYESAKGDPSWIGKISARAELDNGSFEPILAETTDFEMGRPGKDNPEGKKRTFRFNR